MAEASDLIARARACRLCADRFAATATAHAPSPVVWLRPGARILIAGQAPGLRVHQSGRPFDDPSGVRLRAWMGIDEDTFWDPSRIAFLPMALCFPGYDAKGADLPPPALCAQTWRHDLLAALGDMPLVLLVGAAAQRWHLGRAAMRGGLTASVAAWRTSPAPFFPLPHPSWRNSAWIKRNPWFTDELLPDLRHRIARALGGKASEADGQDGRTARQRPRGHDGSP